AVETVQGKIWQASIDKEQLPDFKKAFQVISHHVSEGKMLIHVYADDKPDEAFDQADATLEDVYFSSIHKN
ncbi:MAG: hypothetical protein MUE99_10810, partial [Chitinophagaceae bacterium]|nr:hypothetical protein [Chitinophagaceae bacterium]